MLTTLAEKCLETPTPVLEVSTEEAEEAERSSRREVRTPEAMLPLTRSETAIGTCPITEEIEISTSPNLTGKTAEILVTEISMTSSLGQATTPLPEDQSDLPLALPCPPTTSLHREGTWGTSSLATTLLPTVTEAALTHGETDPRQISHHLCFPECSARTRVTIVAPRPARA